ncbi:MAG: hypothetical protein HKN26_14860, partial [Acidimicrobiales bacterium]|nr:hypothetical protein [Acidimicrobiales bacterium]
MSEPTEIDPSLVAELMEPVADVDWSQLSHAYGPATDVPDLLRLWLGNDQRDPATAELEHLNLANEYGDTVGRRAENNLIGSVFHQGSLYSASAPVATVLLAALERHPLEAVRISAIHLLATCLASHHDGWEADGFHPAVHERPDVWAAAAAGWPLFLELLDPSEPPEIRLITARALPWLDRPEECTAAIVAALDNRDADDDVTPLLVLALGTLAPGTDFEAEPLVRSLLTEPEPLGLAAAIALARLRCLNPETDAAIVERIRAASDADVGRFGNRDRAWSHAHEGDLGDLIADALAAVGRPDDGESALLPLEHGLAPRFAGQRARIAPLGAGRSFALLPFGDKLIHVVSLESLGVVRTLRRPKVAELGSIPTHEVDSSRRQEAPELHGTPPDLAGLRFLRIRASPDGRWLAADSAGVVAVWDLRDASETPVALLTGFLPTRVNFAWSPDSRWLLTGEAPDLHLWEAGYWEGPSEIHRVIGASDVEW